MNPQSKISIWGVVFISFFSVYFGYLSQMLPDGAGPDELAHLKAAQFIYEHDRLPIYPADKDELYYSIFGATRSFRPPLIYIAAAQLHRFADSMQIELRRPYRMANAIVGGFCALFLLLSLYLYTNKTSLAVIFTSAFMLMPQVGFIYSYLNADGAAIMACTLILLSVSLLLKTGINIKTLIFFGISCGILSLCKVTAWIFCLPLCIFAVIIILYSKISLLKSFSTVFLCFAVTAGWRIVFNMYFHGLDNPFNWNLDAQLNTLYATVNLENIVNYNVQGKSYLDLLTNFDNFMSRTFLSFVGQLDWLRLRVGPLQYMSYGIIILAALIASVFALLRPALTVNYNRTDYFFELSILSGFIFLFFMYMHFNINNDIQTQGKYVLPAFTGLLLILASSFRSLFSITVMSRLTSPLKSGACIALVLVLAYIHLQGLYKYIIPFYYSQAYVDTAPDRFKPIAFTDNSASETGDLELVEKTSNTLKFRVSGPDPRYYLKDLNIDTNSDLVLLKIQLVSSKSNYYSFYWDNGSGMSESTMVKGFVHAGNHTIYQILPVSSFIHLRFDLGTPNSNFTIKNLEYSPLKFKPLIPLLNKFFKIKPADY